METRGVVNRPCFVFSGKLKPLQASVNCVMESGFRPTPLRIKAFRRRVLRSKALRSKVLRSKAKSHETEDFGWVEG